MSQTVVLSVRMSCEGCSGAVKRVLSKMEGVESFDIDMKEQKVTVIGNVEPEVVLQTVAKTGKKSSFWEEEVEAVKTDTKAEEVEAKTAEKTETKATKAEEVEVEAETAVKTGTKVEEEIEVEAETTSVEIEKTKPAEVEAKEAAAAAPPSVGIETKPAEVVA
ncbi:copper transport protein CCH-like [Impatiens glandulifera]|uniref:copper transport protein CCH-like n=1 Tax=Impatiens glandulifera TaxID=253017 RepID=UPI001FB08D2B|nr:copper transport protein CCH-like [Impatiens glandulifera]